MPAKEASERSEIASLAAHARWGRERDRSAATAPGRAAWRARFEAELPDDITDPDQRRTMVDHRVIEFMLRERRARRKRPTEAQAEQAEAELEAAGFGFPGLLDDRRASR